ncbi:putative zinc finger protein, partial [Coccomyxa subellipsoidea C-169]
ATRLQRLTAATRASLEQHVRAEEQELWPLFAEYFTEAEQDHLVGVIIGRTGAEVLQAMLPWVTESFTEGEQRAMMDSLRSATRNTGFERWLDAALRPRDGSDTAGESPKAPTTDADSPKAADGAASNQHGGSKAQKEPGGDAGVFKPGWEDIFRMNQKTLEEAVRRIGSDEGLDAQRKAYLMQNIMASRYIVAQQRRMQSTPVGHAAAGGRRCYHDARQHILGCPHYKRGCQVVAPCCGNVYPCKKCHDAEEDHVLESQKVEMMVCMACNLQQTPAGVRLLPWSCSGCGAAMARYYCDICHLWDDQPGRSIYHCPFCNLCRVGEGLGVDACHCMDCNTCMHLSEFATHKCRGLSSCPVCTEPLFESSQPYRELPCGHFMHSHCFAQYTRYNYTCPICAKSMGDMSVYFGMLDSILAKDVCDLPPAYASRRQVILCNDCGRQGEAPFHFVYHKCSSCNSYNTRVLQ